ncbi:hypothetical protein [Microbacterium gorillae]|uniref:hypothetical protein n=1 Tax=Microbacterium gorillae TaxID=1231063 RepID=UPI003D994883
MNTRNRSIAASLTCVIAAAIGLVGATAANAQNLTATTISSMAADALTLSNPSAAEIPTLRTALATGSIQHSDYEALHERYVQCVIDAGFDPQFRTTSHGVYVEMPYRDVGDTEKLNEATARCGAESATVQALFRAQQAGAKLTENPYETAISCLQQVGVVDASYSANQLAEDWSKDRMPFDASDLQSNDCLYEAGFAYFTIDDE